MFTCIEFKTHCKIWALLLKDIYNHFVVLMRKHFLLSSKLLFKIKHCLRKLMFCLIESMLGVKELLSVFTNKNVKKSYPCCNAWNAKIKRTLPSAVSEPKTKGWLQFSNQLNFVNFKFKIIKQHLPLGKQQLVSSVMIWLTRTVRSPKNRHFEYANLLRILFFAISQRDYKLNVCLVDHANQKFLTMHNFNCEF